MKKGVVYDIMFILILSIALIIINELDKGKTLFR
jgi:hypothetical protein